MYCISFSVIFSPKYPRINTDNVTKTELEGLAWEGFGKIYTSLN